MKFSHATLYIITSATFTIGALALQGCSDSTPSTGDASPTVDSAATDSGPDSSADSLQPLIDSGQEASIDSASDSATDAAAADSAIVVPLDASLDVSLVPDALGFSDGSGDSSDAHVE